MVKADWKSHHIEGYARAALDRGIDPRIDCELLTQTFVTDNGGELWQGGFAAGVDLTDEGFDQIISLYPWEGRYTVGSHTEILEIRAYDSPTQDPAVFVGAAQMAAGLVEVGKKVLVHCQAGLNRSGVVTALTLINLGLTAEDAIALMREKRSPLVLCNEAFENWVLEQ